MLSIARFGAQRQCSWVIWRKMEILKKVESFVRTPIVCVFTVWRTHTGLCVWVNVADCAIRCPGADQFHCRYFCHELFVMEAPNGFFPLMNSVNDLILFFWHTLFAFATSIANEWFVAPSAGFRWAFEYLFVHDLFFSNMKWCQTPKATTAIDYYGPMRDSCKNSASISWY